MLVIGFFFCLNTNIRVLGVHSGNELIRISIIVIYKLEFYVTMLVKFHFL